MLIQTDAIGDKYDTLIDRESAEELLAAKAAEATAAAAGAKAATEADKAAAAQAKADAQAAKEAARAQAAQAKADAADSARPSARRPIQPWTEDGDLRHPRRVFVDRPSGRQRDRQAGVRLDASRHQIGRGADRHHRAGVLGDLLRGR